MFSDKNSISKEKTPIQKILFGSPGTGKSHRIKEEIIPINLGIDRQKSPEDIIKTVFHPEYTYGDFMGKLVPITKSGKVEYNYYEGHFLKALGQAYKNIQMTKPKSFQDIRWEDISNVVLVIDEINRGNSSAIFGVAFQLLDRDESGWSDYSVNLTEVEFYKFIELIGTKISLVDGNLKFQFPGDSHFVFFENLKDKFSPLGINTETKEIKLPPNLSILATMNTSDNSIYFMDSAFKRRWDWEFINWDNSRSPEATYGKNGILDASEWKKLFLILMVLSKSITLPFEVLKINRLGFILLRNLLLLKKFKINLCFLFGIAFLIVTKSRWLIC